MCNIEGDIGFLNLKKFLNANVPIHEFEQSLSNVEVFQKAAHNNVRLKFLRTVKCAKNAPWISGGDIFVA